MKTTTRRPAPPVGSQLPGRASRPRVDDVGAVGIGGDGVAGEGVALGIVGDELAGFVVDGDAPPQALRIRPFDQVVAGRVQVGAGGVAIGFEDAGGIGGNVERAGLGHMGARVGIGIAAARNRPLHPGTVGAGGDDAAVIDHVARREHAGRDGDQDRGGGDGDAEDLRDDYADDVLQRRLQPSARGEKELRDGHGSAPPANSTKRTRAGSRASRGAR